MLHIFETVGREGRAFLNTMELKKAFLKFFVRRGEDLRPEEIRKNFESFRANIIYSVNGKHRRFLPPIIRAAKQGRTDKIRQLLSDDPMALVAIQPSRTKPHYPSSYTTQPYALSRIVNQRRLGPGFSSEQVAECIEFLGPFDDPEANLNILTLAIACDPSGETIGNICKALTSEESEFLDAADARGQTPLFSAVKLGYLRCVEALLNGGAFVDARSAGGRTPLMEAAWRCDPIMVRALLTPTDSKRRASVWSFVSRIESPLSLAVMNRRSDNEEPRRVCIELMLDRLPENTNLFSLEDWNRVKIDISTFLAEPKLKDAAFTCLTKFLEALGDAPSLDDCYKWLFTWHEALGDVADSSPECLGLLHKACCAMLASAPSKFKTLLCDIEEADLHVTEIATWLQDAIEIFELGTFGPIASHASLKEAVHHCQCEMLEIALDFASEDALTIFCQTLRMNPSRFGAFVFTVLDPWLLHQAAQLEIMIAEARPCGQVVALANQIKAKLLKVYGFPSRGLEDIQALLPAFMDAYPYEIVPPPFRS